MSDSKCPQCGTFVTDELPGGLCPACLMQAAQKSALAADHRFGETLARAQGLVAPDIASMESLFPELEVMELIGQGGMGAVYRVRQKNLDRIVALKIFLYRPDDPEFAARFQREARALAKLNHPNIVTVHDFGTRDDTHFLIMEFVDGLNLRQITSSENISPEMALQMVPQLCDALQYAHDQGVIHRDIKPENLLIDTSGRIKIADFGLAKITGSENPGTLTHTRQVMGTLNYMAPEQREKPSEVDHRADIYSLGVVIYEMLTGELPLGRFLPPSEKSEFDKRLDEAVMRALEKEPNRRYQQASEFKTGFTTGTATAAASFAALRDPVTPIKQFLNSEQRPRIMLSIFGGRERTGSWKPGKPQIAFTMMGGTKLDLTEVADQEVRLNLFTFFGATEVIVPRDANIEVDGFMLFGAHEENITKPESTPKQTIRIRSFGAFGGCEVRSANTPPIIKPTKPTKFNQYRLPREHEINLRNGLVFLYKTTASLVGLAAVISFVLGALNVLDRPDGKLVGIVIAISCGMMWAGLDYFRRLIGAGPENNDEESLRKYYSSSIVGTLIRCVALAFGFGAPMLFIASAFERHDDHEIRIAAIVCAVISIALFTVAKYVEEFLYGKLKE